MSEHLTTQPDIHEAVRQLDHLNALLLTEALEQKTLAGHVTPELVKSLRSLGNCLLETANVLEPMVGDEPMPRIPEPREHLEAEPPLPARPSKDVNPVEFTAHTLFYNQPSLNPNPPTIEIQDGQTLTVDGEVLNIKMNARFLLNALLANRARPISSKQLRSHGYPERATNGATMQAFRRDMDVLIESFRPAGEPVIETIGIRGGTKYQIDKDLLIIDKRSISSPPPPDADAAIPGAAERSPDDSPDRPMLQKLNRYFRDDPELQIRLSKLRRSSDRTDSHADADVAGAYHLEPVKAYMKEVGQYKLLTAAEEVELAGDIQKGIEAFERMQASGDFGNIELQKLAKEAAYAYQVFFHSNLRLVISNAKRYAGLYPHLEFMDIIQFGNFGLQRAIEKFDASKGFKFSTYATTWIKQSIQRGTANESRIIRLPAHAHTKWQKLSRIEREFTQQHDRVPALEDLMEVTGMSAREIKLLRDSGTTSMRSLNQMISDGGDTELGEFIGGHNTVDDSIEEFSNNEEVKALLATPGLSYKEKYVLSLRYGVVINDLIGTEITHRGKKITYSAGLNVMFQSASPLTLEAVGQLLGVTRERVRQLENQALQTIRNKHARLSA